MKNYSKLQLQFSKNFTALLVVAAVGFIPQISYSADVPTTGGTAGNYTLNSSVVVTSGVVTNTSDNTKSTVVLSGASNGNTLTVNSGATITETNGKNAITLSGNTTANITVAGGTITAASGDSAIYTVGRNIGTITISSGVIAATGSGSAINTSQGGTIEGIINYGLVSAETGSAIWEGNNTIANGITNLGILRTTGGNAIRVSNNGALVGSIVNGSATNSTATIEDTAGGKAVYLASNVTGGVDNYGIISSITGNAVNVNAAQTAAFTNESTGVITSGTAGTTFNINYDISNDLLNYGTIENTSSGSAININGDMATGGIINEIGGIIQNTSTGNAISILADIGGGVNNSGLISVGSGNGIYINAAATGDINNLGTVQSTAGTAINVNAPLTGTITNGSASNSAATIQDTSTGTGLSLGADVTGGVQNYGTISSVAGTAVNVSAAQSGVITNESTGVITTAGTGGAIVIADVATGGITNDGTISSTNGAPIAIDASAQTTGSNAFTITNNGTIAGEVKLGAGDTFTQNSGSTSNGSNVAILGLDGSETVNLNGGTISGDIGASGKSIGTLNIGSAQTLSNIYSTAMNFTNDSTLDITSGSSFNSDNFATAAITTATDNTGTIDFNGSTDINNIIGTSANRLKAVNFDGGTVNVNQSVNSYSMNIASGVLANFFANINHNISSLTNNGTMVVGANNTVSGLGDLVIGSGGILTIGVESPTSYSRLSGTSLTNNGIINIDASNITTALPNNTLLTGVFTGTTAPSVVNNLQLSSNNSAYRFFEKINGNNVDILVQDATPSNNGSLLDVIQHASVSSIEGRISALTSDAAALQHVAPAAGGDGTDQEPMPMHYKNIWADVFGSDIKQNQHADVSGYNALMSGVIVGADVYLDKDETATAGAALAYSGTNSTGVGTESDTGSYQGSLYYTYKPVGSKLYYDGIASFAYNKYESDRILPDATVANSKFSGTQYSVKNGVNYDINIANKIKLTPMASLQYSLLSQNPYTETGSSANMHIDTQDINVLKSGLGTKISRVFNYNEIIYTPTLSVEWLHDFIGDATQTTANFDGTSTYVTAKGSSVLKDSARIGAGVNVVMNSHFNLSLNYGLEKMPDYTVNSLSVKSSYEF